jgi:hypothetical protein
MIERLGRQHMKLAPHSNRFGAFLKEDLSVSGRQSELYGTGGNTLVCALFHSSKNVSEIVHYRGDAYLKYLVFTLYCFPASCAACCAVLCTSIL